MGPRGLRFLVVLGFVAAAAPLLRAQVFVVGAKSAEYDAVTEFHPTHVDLPREPMDERGHLQLLRDLEAEQGFAHRELPLGAGLTLIANGNMTPRDEVYKKMLYEKGQSAAPGERVAITALKFERDRLVIDFNGGPYDKHRFLSHVSLNDIQLAQRGPTATGCRITLVFEGGLPDVTAAEVKALLDPVVDFRAKTSEEAYANTLQPKVRAAIEAHEVMVGMDRRMVLAAVGTPISRHREHTDATNADSPVWEEWIYGQAPQPTKFVRFRSGRVVRLEIAALGKPVEIRDKNEMGNEAEPVLQARTIANGDAQRDEEGVQHTAPTLRKPGEVMEGAPGLGKVNLPADTPSHAPKQMTGGER